MTVDNAQLSYAHAVVNRPVSDTVRTFLTAQKIDTSLTVPADHICYISADDDESLVNAYLIIDEAVDGIDADVLVKYLDSPNVDPARTDLILPEKLVGLEPQLRQSTRGKIRRTVRISEFLDGHLRPKSICADLMKPQSPSADSSSLLSTNDFVDQWAQTERAERVYASDYLFNQWAGGTAPRLCLVLAPAGYGKSKVTHVLARKMAANYAQPLNVQTDQIMRPPVPILIAFGEYRSYTSFAGLILQALNKHGRTRLTVEAFQFLISLGRAVFILDGYDEMMEANPDTARHNVAEFIQQAGPESRILLTSRSVFYRTSTDVVGQVGDPLLAESEVEILELQPFDRPQARLYLRKRLEHVNGHSRTLERAQEIIENDDAMSILSSPIFLAEFASDVAEGRWSIKDVRQHGGLEFLIKRAFTRERRRQGHEFTDDQQRAFLEGFAFEMLSTGAAGYTRDELEVLVAEAIDDDLLLESWNKLVSHHFLAPSADRPNALVTMKHQVWRDYFQGTALARGLAKRNARATTLINSRDLPEGVLRAAAKNLPFAMWAWLMTDLSHTQDKKLRNLIKLHLLQADGPEKIILPDELALSLEGGNLAEMSFHNFNFEGASFANTNLTGTYFDHCDLSGSSLQGACLSGTVFRSCNLSDTIAEAEVASVQIDDVLMYEPQIRARFGAATNLANEEPDLPELYKQTVRTWANTILRGRLAKFVKRKVGEHNVAVDDSISWIAFMGGTNPKERDFVVRRLYRSLRAEGVVTSGKLTANGRPTILLSSDPQVRSELVHFVEDGTTGPTIKSVIERLVK